jgi:hypothetical protein
MPPLGSCIVSSLRLLIPEPRHCRCLSRACPLPGSIPLFHLVHHLRNSPFLLASSASQVEARLTSNNPSRQLTGPISITPSDSPPPTLLCLPPEHQTFLNSQLPVVTPHKLISLCRPQPDKIRPGVPATWQRNHDQISQQPASLTLHAQLGPRPISQQPTPDVTFPGLPTLVPIGLVRDAAAAIVAGGLEAFNDGIMVLNSRPRTSSVTSVPDTHTHTPPRAAFVRVHTAADRPPTSDVGRSPTGQIDQWSKPYSQTLRMLSNRTTQTPCKNSPCAT